MYLNRGTWITIILVAVIAICGTGWFIAAGRTNRNNEMLALQKSFVQEYGGKAIVKQLVLPKDMKVYAALWTGEDGVSHVSASIAGVWVLIKNMTPTTP